MRIKTLVALYFWILECDDVTCIRSIIALLFIQNISRALKIYNFFLLGFCRVHGKIARYLKTMNKKRKRKMTNKTLFKEVTNLPLEAK